jgi:hypothetical protein
MFGFPEVWCCDFEFGVRPTGSPNVHCMVAKELRSQRQIRLWSNELYALKKAPFDTGPNSLFVAYSAGAEISCFIELGWTIPLRILDLYAEYLACSNGRRAKKAGTGLLHAMEHYGLGHVAPAEKANMRALAIRGAPWTAQEMSELLDYCAEDVDSLCRLLPAMKAELEPGRHSEWLFRGRYMAAIQCIEQYGVPLDVPMLEAIREQRLNLITRLTGRLEASYRFGIYDGSHFRLAAFRDWTRSVGLRWPSTASGLPATDDRTFRRMIVGHPRVPIQPLHECIRSIDMLSKFEITADPDGRSRCWLAPFRSESGRNQPSNSRFIFGAPSWLRHLIKPVEGWGVAYCDWSAQEIAIAAGLSGDERMIEDYATGDVYIRLAIALRLAPPGATKASHPGERERCKVIYLGTNYGQGAFGLSERLGCRVEEAKELLARFAATYPTFHAWRQSIVNGAARPGILRTALGWPWWTGNCKNKRTVMNHPAQSNGSDMMRLAAVAAVEAGLQVCAPVHDAFLIAAPVERLEDDVTAMLEIMRQAGRVVAGIPVRASCETILGYPERFVPEKGRETWALVQQLLNEMEVNPDVDLQSGRLRDTTTGNDIPAAEKSSDVRSWGAIREDPPVVANQSQDAQSLPGTAAGVDLPADQDPGREEGSPLYQ